MIYCSCVDLLSGEFLLPASVATGLSALFQYKQNAQSSKSAPKRLSNSLEFRDRGVQKFRQKIYGLESTAKQVCEKAKAIKRHQLEARQRSQCFRLMILAEKQIRNGLIPVKGHFCGRPAGLVVPPRSFREVATLLVQKTKNKIRKRSNPWLD